jgi:hypothetical protein
MPDQRWDHDENHAAMRFPRDGRRRADGYTRWLMLIKHLRLRFGLSIDEAERLALVNPHRRRWVERCINTHQACRKRALAHIRHYGARALIQREGERFCFRIPPIG